MATPTKSQTASTPKPHLSTPNRLMASPRPGTSSNANRPLAHKSPAVKTPASVHGHAHHVSVSSQPSSTPLAATAIHDDLLALNSPATALIASLGPTGLTPLGSGGDGLGITTNLPGTSIRAPAAPVNPDAERLHRAQFVADTLKTRVAGRGITREGVERIAQLQGFTTLWDEGNLTIAGNAVDLEINFDADNRDYVKDVGLKLNTPGSEEHSEEPQLQEEGTGILRDNLRPWSVLDGTSQWTSLDTFESNLQYLSRLDHIEGGAPCFEAVRDLYNAFQKIWNAEKERWKNRPVRHHIRNGAIGRPSIDRKPRLGLSLDYWVGKQDVEQRSESDTDDTMDDSTDVYAARISCAPGAPSTVLARQWVSEQVLMAEAPATLGPETEQLKPDWQDPAHDAGNSDRVMKGGLEMHFECSLRPEVYLPLNIVASLNVDFAMLEMDQEMAVTYQMALQPHLNVTNVGGAKTSREERWPRSLPTTTDVGDPPRFRQHSYALHSAQHAAPLWCYPVKQLKFTHPKQLAAMLPVLRQYALVWRILRSLVDYGIVDQWNASTTFNVDKTRASDTVDRPLKRSNMKPLGTQLETFLKANGSLPGDEVLPVDLSLDVISDISKARLDVFVPLRGSLARGMQSPFIFLSLNICQGGQVEIRDLRGVQADGADDLNLRAKLVRILTTTEDVGLTVEWLLEQARARIQ
ncbi:uncharacterized protein Z518_09918 [Rhinocladiella mackenziei CBS 650.93]|uniref:Mediator of RNA polymerase II transcription subunit 1 n=1 Tax=Rhinocladiella mackenziei CBS 650.93 TaxID=1442369 RepID=A0A0D2GRA3_9EURO|nr:uncharacterized protein Z518_09918 [Rhinocladiella mackenziei CBS 650.93]KIX00853.1 hypothetical protein Z518_09918 [Rhinocladiella mackenziei CBS 650.93]